MPRTADLLVIHDTDDDAQRESLGKLLLAGGKDVEVEWIDPSRAVALIVPRDLENSPTEERTG
jgi:hypothetical protein